MLDTIKNKLKALGCDTYELTEKTVTAWEFYFIRHKLDQNRTVKTRTVEVTLYRPLEDGKFLGSASGTIYPTASEAEIDAALSRIYYQASLVKNPFYTLTDKEVPKFKFKAVDAAAIAESFVRAMQAVPETATERINSYEIFAREVQRHFENSNGVSSTVLYPDSMIEVVVNASKGDHEIELYRSFTSGVCDAAKLTAEVEKALHYGKDRLVAEPTPKLGKADVLFIGADSVSLYEYFGSRMSAGMQFRKLSDWTKGKPIAAYTTGDKLSLFAAANLENSSKSFPIDEEGAFIKERYLIENGVACSTFGSRQMSEYLGEKDSSLVYNFVVSGGTASENELRTGDYLELVEFSDFQVDPVGGDILGEIRLGYWHHDGKMSIITGGSVSGTMQDLIPSMRFTKETQQFDTAVVPAATKLFGVTITGVK